MKTVRQLAVTRLTEFFEFMTDYDFKPICESVFSSAVWPQVRPCTGHTQHIQDCLSSNTRCIEGRESRVVIGERNACFGLVKFNRHRAFLIC